MKTALLLCLGSLVLATSSTAQISPRRSPTGDFNAAAAITRTARGADIPNFLGSRMAQVAARHGRTVEQLRELCRNNRHLRADAAGLLHFACEAPLPMQLRAATLSVDGNGGSVLSGTVSADEVFKLHSRPGSSKVIYLDFDGHVTTGTSWNSSAATSSITTPPYSTDATVSVAFSQTELNNMHSIWQRVAEDYAPFDVDVTTEDPGLDALRKSNAADGRYGLRVCIGGNSTWYGSGIGGVAYLGSFTWNSDTPAFVFSASLGSGNPKYTAEAVSHEAGHTFGLHHDGQTGGTEYYAGHGNWAPIMGVGYSKEIVQWSRGEYSNANNKENDTAIIAAVLGLRADAAGDSVANAAPWPAPSAGSASLDGVIQSADDADLYAFSTAAGEVSFTLTPVGPSPNLDSRLSLYDAQGNWLQSAEPSTLGASLVSTLAQGTYYIAVEGVGAGLPTTSYNDYGSLGQFKLVGSTLPLSGASPQAVASALTTVTGQVPLQVSFSSDGSSDSDGSIVAYHWDFGDGTDSAEANPVHTYTKAGRFVASLVVTDDSGLSSPAAEVTIEATTSQWLAANGLQLMLYGGRRQGTQVLSWLTVRDSNGQPVRNALVRGQWSGLFNATVSGFTSRGGQIGFLTPYLRGPGSVTFTLTGLQREGFVYDPSRNTSSSATANLR